MEILGKRSQDLKKEEKKKKKKSSKLELSLRELKKLRKTHVK